MRKRLPVNIQLVLYTFCISVILNTAVVTPHILTVKKFELNESISIFLLTVAISIAIFALASIVVYILISLFAKMNREKLFWGLMITGITTAVFSGNIFSNFLAKYNDQSEWIPAIAGFSIMCALTSQYQLFMGPENKNTDSPS